MSVASRIRRLWQSIVPRASGEIEEEFRSNLEAYREDLIRQGLTPEEATRKARIDLGQPATQNETYRDAIGLRLFDELGGDIRYGLRALRRNPGFAAVAVLSLALGIGATTAMFSLIYAVLLHPFPYANADRIMNPVVIDEEHPGEPVWFATMKPQFDTLGRAKSIEGLLGFAGSNMEITGGAIPEDLIGAYLTENANTFFGVHALLGRGIQPSDAQGGGQPVVVLNYKFWQRHFHGDPHVIGRTLELDHVPYTIIGVMPRSFAFNDTTGVGDVYLPRSLLHDSVNPPVTSPYIPWIKLKPHISPAAADAELNAIVRQFAKENPNHFPKKWHLQLQPIIGPFQQNTVRPLVLLLAGVLLLLIIGCANCSILLLARGRARQHELAVRAAIGASRWRIVRQLLVEAIVISVTGAILGVAASYWLAELPMQLSPSSFPNESVIRMNLPILAFSVALALLSGLLFGLVPALRLSSLDLARTLPSRQRGISSKPAKHRWSTLIAAQVALTLLLMATAGTAIRSFLHLMQLPLGYNPDQAMQVGIVMHFRNLKEWDSIRSRETRTAYIEEIRQKIAAVPGVRNVAVGINAAPPYSGADGAVEISGVPRGENQSVRIHSVSPHYFNMLRIPLLRRRIWTASENDRGDFVAVVNQSFVRRYWPNINPLNGQLRLPELQVVGPLDAMSSQAKAWRQVLGVVGDVRNDGVDRPVAPAIYMPYTTLMPPFAQFLIRTQGEPLSYLHSIRAAIASVAPEQQLASGTFTLKQAIEGDAQWSRQRLFSILFGVFSAMALALALVGIFSVVAYSIAQRTTEFGVRLALGAPRPHILWVAARIALISTAVGVALGLALDAFLGKLLAAWMHSNFAATGLVSAAALLAVSALLACLLPAQRATSVPPAEALRYE
ncbi:MAG TPA: ABC transporter permease [Acidobacteriaceae bacterium]